MSIKNVCRKGVYRQPIGMAIIDRIIEGRLLRTECPAAPDEGTLTVWSANATEQLEALIEDYLRSGDLELEPDPVEIA